MLFRSLDPGIGACERVVDIEKVTTFAQLYQLAMQLRSTIAVRIDIDDSLRRRGIGRCNQAIDARWHRRARRARICGKMRNARAVKQKHMVELVQELQVRAILLERAGPQLEQVCHGDLASTAPILDTR